MINNRTVIGHAYSDNSVLYRQVASGTSTDGVFVFSDGTNKYRPIDDRGVYIARIAGVLPGADITSRLQAVLDHADISHVVLDYGELTISGTLNCNSKTLIFRNGCKLIGTGTLSNAFIDASMRDDIIGRTLTMSTVKPENGRYSVQWFGAKGDNSNDDTPAIQYTLNTCFNANGGVVFFPNGVYKLSSPCIRSVDGIDPNCQIYIPVSSDFDNPVTIVLLGETIPNHITGPTPFTINPPENGVVLYSTLNTNAGGTPAVIGYSYFNTGYSDGSWTVACFHNLTIRTKVHNSGTPYTSFMMGINAEKCSRFIAHDIVVDTDQFIVDMAQPGATYGIKMPQLYSFAVHDIGRLFIVGYGTGIRLTEHGTIQYCLIVGCTYGVEVGEAGHVRLINHLQLEGVKYHIYFKNNSGKLVVSTYGSEKSGSGWYAFSTDASWESSSSTGRLVILSENQQGGDPVWTNPEFTTIIDGWDRGTVYGSGTSAFSKTVPAGCMITEIVLKATANMTAVTIGTTNGGSEIDTVDLTANTSLVLTYKQFTDADQDIYFGNVSGGTLNIRIVKKDF